MTPTMQKFLKSTNLLIVIFISVLGLCTSCQKDEAKGNFVITGKVVSKADNNPVRDIIVEVRNTKLLETSFTNYYGDYDAGIYDFPGDRTFSVRFSDTDGALNGEFESFDTTVVFKDPVFINGNGSDWAGYVDLILNVKLKPKK
jgi:putative lipoprotein (rSAM/lipoprotein system)